MSRRLAALAVGLIVLVAACGDDSAAADEELVDEVVAAMDLSPPEGFPPDVFGDTEARCWAVAMVEVIGAENLEAVGFGAGGFADEAEATEALDSIGVGLDEPTAREYLGRAMDCVDFTPFLAEEMIAEGLPREASYCVAEAIVASDVMLDSMVSGMLGREMGEEAGAEIMRITLEAMTECLSPEEMAELIGG